MTDYDFCRVCKVPRYVEGDYNSNDYLAMGWIRETFEREDVNGEFSFRVEWLCPDCRKKELDEERKHEEEWQKLRKASLSNDPALYERLGDGHRGERSS